ncbi:MAG: hypothetical protein ACTHK7_12955 [Aureliella sp.]
MFSLVVFGTSVFLLALFSATLVQAVDGPGDVDKLASSNSPFVIRGRAGRQKATQGPVFDSDESERVRKQLTKLSTDCESAWPELVSHLTDKRHSGIIGIDAGYPRNLQVGDVCLLLIGETLSAPFYELIPNSKMNYHRFRIPAFAKDREKLKKWCQNRKDRKLYELQIEACQWALTELDSPDIQPRDVSAEEKLIIAQQIRDEIENLKRTRSAVPLDLHIDFH